MPKTLERLSLGPVVLVDTQIVRLFLKEKPHLNYDQRDRFSVGPDNGSTMQRRTGEPRSRSLCLDGQQFDSNLNHDE